MPTIQFHKKNTLRIAFSIMLIFITAVTKAQNGYMISGKVTEAVSGNPLQKATVHLKGSGFITLSKTDGSFRLQTDRWYDSLQVTNVDFETSTIALKKGNTTNLSIILKIKASSLQAVVIDFSKIPDKSFMQKVIEQKPGNNPARFRSYSFTRYTRNELDIDKVDFENIKGSGLKSLVLHTYMGLDSGAIQDKELPVYFKETIADMYHSVSPTIDGENVVAQKTLGLKTDQLVARLNKFYLKFNVYDDWVPIFDQTYVGPLNTNAFNYYKYFKGTAAMEDGDSIQEIRFVPLRDYERCFSGILWINKRTFAITSVEMHLNKTANLNFVKDISYSEDYQKVYDNNSDSMVYMPYKYVSNVKFETGMALLGIPTADNQKSLQLIIRNKTVCSDTKLNTEVAAGGYRKLIDKEVAADWEKPESFWSQNRPEALSAHENNIYKLIDSLKGNSRFQRDIKIAALVGTGYWDFGKQLRIGPYSSFISTNSIEGWRFRLGFWTMPAISQRVNFFGYGAYGTKDQKLKGMLGLKYVWNPARWTKTTISYSSDYDLIISQDDELDNDNLINSMFRKNIPYTRTYAKQAMLRHEQYLSGDFTATASVDYKELNPVFDFQYRPINPQIDKPFDSVYKKVLPVAEVSVGIRYDHNERTKILNYDKLRLGSFSPILSLNYTYGFEAGNAQFVFHKLNVGIQQRLRLPPKMMLFYKLDAGKVFGTIPYLLLNIPPGNEYYVASKYKFNTMIPYEFAADRYISLHTRFYLGGALFDKIPLLQKLGWRERFSFNAYWGDMSKANLAYNKNSNFHVTNKMPFMEASAGIENIFHIISIEYYRRLNYLNNPYAQKGGLYMGLTLTF